VVTKARAFTIAGLVHFTVAALLAMTFLVGQPGTALGSGMVITRTPTPTRDGNGNGKCKLTCTKTADPTEVSPGDEVTFFIEVRNVGDKKCEDVDIIDEVPGQLDMVSPLPHTIEELDPGARAVTFVAWVGSNVKPCTSFTNKVHVGERKAEKKVTCSATLFVPCLPDGGENAAQSGQVAPQAVVVGLLVMGAGLLAAGLVLRAKNRAP